jgi:uncharacterized repeat protein (TIGR01451 family)
MAKLQRVLAVLSLFLAPVLFGQSADVSVTVTDSPDPVMRDGTITYTVQVANGGPNAATNATMTVYNSSGLGFVSVTEPTGWSCTEPASGAFVQFSCTNPSLAAGASSTFTLVATTDTDYYGNNEGTIATVFSAGSSTADPDGANNMEQETTTYLVPDADVSVTVTDAPDPVAPDGNITYTVTVANAGPDPATNITLNSFGGNNLRFVSGSFPNTWNCTLPSPGTQTTSYSCTNAAGLASGASSVFTFVMQADDAFIGIQDTTIQFGFSANSSVADPVPGNNSETEPTAYVTPDADVSVAVTDSPDPVGPDGNITYTVTVANAGPDTAPNITLNSFGGNNLRFVSGSFPATWNCTLPSAGTQTTSYSCTNAAGLASGASSVFTFVMQADDALIGNADTTIQFGFSANSSIFDPVAGNNSETESTAYDVSNANLGLAVTDAPDPVAAGSNITYSGTITSAGPDTATNVTFTVPLHSSLLYVSHSGPAGFTCTTPAVGATGTITCTAASVANGASIPFSVVAQVSPSLNNGPDGTLSQLFLIGASTNDPTGTNNTVQVFTSYTTPDADLSTTNMDTPDPVTTGGTITYTQTITNNGPDAATNVTFSETLPASVGFQSIVAAPGFTCTTPAVSASGAITCTAATLASGTTGTFTVVVTVIAASGPIGNMTVVDSNTFDPDPTDDTATASTTVLAATNADLSVTKTTSTTTAPAGSTISYTIGVTNNGPDAATSVVMTDALPASLLFQSITTPTDFTCTTPAAGTSGTITCNAATLASGVTRNFTLVVRVAPNATSGSANNTATVSSATNDPNGGNSSGAAPAVALAPASADLSIAKTTTQTTAQTGNLVTYTITVSNAGPSPATSVVVNDTLPAGLQFVSATPSQGTCNAASPLSCSLGTINSGANATITLVTRVVATSGTISNTATVGSADADPDTADRTATTAPIPVTGDEALSQIPTLSEWALMALAAMLGMVAMLKMRS